MENSFKESIRKLMERDLTKLEDEINQYPTEDLIWMVFGNINNSGGNLCLHICGNLQHFIGSILGNSGYVRNRENEFAAKSITKADLILEIKRTKQIVLVTLDLLNRNTLEADYPIPVFEYRMNTMHFLIHLTAHLEYHLGQINYHRRLVETQ